MASYYETELDRQKKGDTTVNTVLPILAALETIATAKATRGQNVGTSTLGLIKDTYSRRQDALDRATKADSTKFANDLNLTEAANAKTRLGLESAQGAREASRYDREIQDQEEKDNLRKATIDRLLGMPNTVDEATNTVTRSGMPGAQGLTMEDKAAIQADPITWLNNKLKPATMTYLPTVGGYVAAPTRAPSGGGGPVAAPLKTDTGDAVIPIPKPSEKSLAQIEAEAAARAAGAASAAGEKPLSGDAAKLSGFVSTLKTQGEALKKMVQDQGIRKVVYEYKKGNPAYVNVIEDMADAKGRLRSGGAINVDEANSFKKPFTGMGNLIYGDNDAAITAIDKVLQEADNVQASMSRGSKDKPKPSSANTPAPEQAGTVWRKGPDGKEYEYNATTKAPTGKVR